MFQLRRLGKTSLASFLQREATSLSFVCVYGLLSLSKKDASLKETICSSQSKLFPLIVDINVMGGKNENVDVHKDYFFTVIIKDIQENHTYL